MNYRVKAGRSYRRARRRPVRPDVMSRVPVLLSRVPSGVPRVVLSITRRRKQLYLVVVVVVVVVV